MQYIAALIILLVLLAATALETGVHFGWNGLEPRSAVEPEPSRPVAQQARTNKAGDNGPGYIGQFDVAKIDPTGASVFAGRSTPNSSVTVFIDGEPIGSTNTDEHGEWVIVTERRILNPNPKLSIAESSHPADTGSSDEARTLKADARFSAFFTAQRIEDLKLRILEARAEQLASKAPEVVIAAPNGVPIVSNSPQEAVALRTREVLPVQSNSSFDNLSYGRGTRRCRAFPRIPADQEASIDNDDRPRGRARIACLQYGSVFRKVRSRSEVFAGRRLCSSIELIPKGDTEPFTGVELIANGPERGGAKDYFEVEIGSDALQNLQLQNGQRVRLQSRRLSLFPDQQGNVS
jgi:hypothetical protein